jgi:hypothetical protein
MVELFGACPLLKYWWFTANAPMTARVLRALPQQLQQLDVDVDSESDPVACLQLIHERVGNTLLVLHLNLRPGTGTDGLMRTLGRFSNLRDLDLRRCTGISQEGFAALARGTPKLQSLTMRDVERERDGMEVARATKWWKNLRVMHLDTSGSARSLREIFRNCRLLETVWFRIKCEPGDFDGFVQTMTVPVLPPKLVNLCLFTDGRFNWDALLTSCQANGPPLVLKVAPDAIHDVLVRPLGSAWGSEPDVNVTMLMSHRAPGYATRVVHWFASGMSNMALLDPKE